MTDTEKNVETNLASELELASALIDQLGTAFAELKAHKVAESNNVQWNDIESYFRDLESVIKKKLKDLEAKEKEFSERESHNNLLLAEREAAVVAKEQDLMDKVQELKDVAVAAISAARTIYVPEKLEAVNDSLTNGNKLSGAIPSVPILKTYLKDIRRNSQGNGSAGLQVDYNARELEALRNVISCVEEYKLEAEYPLHQLYRRVSQLDKSVKVPRKRAGESSKQLMHPHQHKRPRPEGRFQAQRGRPSDRGSGGGRMVQGQRRGQTSTYTGFPQRFTTPAAPTAYTYPVATQSAYVAQANDPRMYYYGQDDQARTSYSAVPPTYGTYQQPSYPSHQPYM